MTTAPETSSPNPAPAADAFLDGARLPARFEDVEALEDFLARPTPALVDDWAGLDGDLLILGVGGKVGPGLARLARRASPRRRILGVARFSTPGLRERLEAWGVETQACDLLDRDAVARLPQWPNVIFMVGRKFGTTGDEPFTWAMNCYAPALTGETFGRSRIVAFSTLCVYPFAPVAGTGAAETWPVEPHGEYANSCVGRERILQYFSKRHGAPGRLIRLNYAIDMRYGVLHDLGLRILRGTPIPLATGRVNIIWQGDAANQILRVFRHVTTPSSPLNVGGTLNVSVRMLAKELGQRLGRKPVFAGREAREAWVNDTREAQRLLGPPVVPLERMLDWTADWLARGLPVYEKPTHYEVRDGRF